MYDNQPKWMRFLNAENDGPTICQCSSLHKACTESQVDGVKEILERCEKDQLSTTDHYGMTPLMIAAQRGCLSIVKLLVQHGANIDQCKEDGFTTALAIATRFRKRPVVEYLLEKEAKTDFKDANGDTFLHKVCKHSEKGRVSILQHYIKAGANVNAQNNDGVTPLMHAAKKGNINSVAKLVEEKADLNMNDGNHKTACHYAHVEGHINTFKYLSKRTKETLISDLLDQPKDEDGPIQEDDDAVDEVNDLDTFKGSSNNLNNSSNSPGENLNEDVRATSIANDTAEEFDGIEDCLYGLRTDCHGRNLVRSGAAMVPNDAAMSDRAFTEEQFAVLCSNMNAFRESLHSFEAILHSMKQAMDEGLHHTENKVLLSCGGAHNCSLKPKTPLMRKYQDQIKQYLYPDEDFLNELVAAEVLTVDNRACILREKTKEGKANLLITFVDCLGESGMYMFVDVLLSGDTNHRALGELLNDKGEFSLD